MPEQSLPRSQRACPVTGISTHQHEVVINGQILGTGPEFFVVGMSFRTAPVSLREQWAVAPEDRVATAERLKAEFGIDELVLLWTCNRVEIYAVAPGRDLDPKALFRRLSGTDIDLDAEMYCLHGEDALRHLFTVSSGMDSMVLGETEITGQVKSAYEASRLAQLTGKTLNRSFQKALQTAKQIRTRTGIGQGATSVGSVSVMQAMRVFGDGIAQKTALVIGAGPMAEACVRHLVDKGVRSIIVANRSLPRAQELADEFEGKAVSFDRCLEAMVDADIVISSTGCPLAILHADDIRQVMASRPHRPLFMVDIAVPRDIAPEVGEVAGVSLYDIDDLESAIRDTLSQREQEFELCRAIIERKVALIMRPNESQHLKKVLVGA